MLAPAPEPAVEQVGVTTRADFWALNELLGERALAGESDLLCCSDKVSSQGTEGVLLVVSRSAASPASGGDGAAEWLRTDDDRLRELRRRAEGEEPLAGAEAAELRELSERYDAFVSAGVHALDWGRHASRDLFVVWLPLGLAWAVNPGLLPEHRRGKPPQQQRGRDYSAGPFGSTPPGPTDGPSFAASGEAPPAWGLARVVAVGQLLSVTSEPAARRLGQRPQNITLETRGGVLGPFVASAGAAEAFLAEVRQVPGVRVCGGGRGSAGSGLPQPAAALREQVRRLRPSLGRRSAPAHSPPQSPAPPPATSAPEPSPAPAGLGPAAVAASAAE
eukprot:TRINITY_DN31797_c0_g1_i1.p1 TRINITY_DN31797_c0_g1~~TRINITY_DN31797_c0_g1_i1.p1  ORF type:complete len:358 (+),score=100.18 TRINITY_DN31797_c0_g1_i1:76-1074(+)